MEPKESAFDGKTTYIGGFSARSCAAVQAPGSAPRASAPAAVHPSRPLLMVDIDGVISLFGAPSAHAPGDGVREGSLHSIEGIPHFISSTAATHLLALGELYELVWASGWEERANEHLPRLLGLARELPFLRFERAVGRSHAHWKLHAIERYAGARPLAWIDDSFNGACHDWASSRDAPTLLVETSPARGLTEHEAQLLERWAHQLEPPPS